MSSAKSVPERCSWVKLRHPETEDDEDTVSAFCSFIEKFLWREYDGETELIVVINNPSSTRNRYKYKRVTQADFESAWDRAHNPSEYDSNFGSWFTNDIKNSYECKRYE